MRVTGMGAQHEYCIYIQYYVSGLEANQVASGFAALRAVQVLHMLALV
jgi:hypothetical protein